MARAAQVPRSSPDFAIDFPSGKQIHTAEYRGKVVALAFILTTCPHCQKVVRILSVMQNEYGPRGFQVLASAIETMAAMNLPDFIKQFQPPFPVGFNSQDPVQNYLQHPVIFRLLMPQLLFIDREGVIQAQYAGDDKFFAADQEKHLREQIEALLKAGSKKSAAAKAEKKMP